MLLLSTRDPLSRQLLKDTLQPTKTNKYHNRKVTLDGRTFASEKEANRYVDLKRLKQAGIIQSFKCQVPYRIFDAFKKNGRNYRAIFYIADFVVTYPDGHIEIEDTKGLKTEAFKLKHKLFEARYPDLELKIT